MKVLFVFFSADPDKFTATQRKMYAQIKGLNEVGIKAKGIFFTRKDGVSEYEFISFKKIRKAEGNFLKKSRQRSIIIKEFHDLLRELYKEYDFIYLRYPFCSKELYELAKDFGDKLIFEHQSKELIDLEVRKQHWKSLPKSVGNFVGYFEFIKYEYWPEKKYRKKILGKLVKHGVAVTNEIQKSLSQETHESYQVTVVSNGINVSEFKIRTSQQQDEKIKLLYLKGGSNDVAWSGLGKLIDSIANSEYKDQLELWLVGKEESDINAPFVKQLGYKSGEALDQIFNEVTFGVNHLDLYIIGLQESCNLKTREYFSRGLPFLYAADDTDLLNFPEGKQFCFQVSNSESKINIEELVDFIRKIETGNRVAERMHEYALNHLDWKSKAKSLKQMFESIS